MGNKTLDNCQGNNLQQLNEFTLKAISKKLNLKLEIYNPIYEDKFPIKKTNPESFSIKFKYKGIDHYEVVSVELINGNLVDYVEKAIKNHCAKYEFLKENIQCSDQIQFIERAIKIKYPQEIEYIGESLSQNMYESELMDYLQKVVGVKKFDYAQAYEIYMQNFIPYILDRIREIKTKSIKG